MVTHTLNVTFDGINDVPRLPGQSDVSWYSSGGRATIDRYSVYVDAPDDLDATLNLTGTDWRVRMLQVAGDDHITRINDLDNGANREIQYLNLGYNSEVNLTSTKVRYMAGWEGDLHDINLGPQNDWMHWLSLGALVNKLDTAVGWIGGIDVYRGRADFTVRGHVVSIDMRDLNDRLVVDGGRVTSASMQDGNDTVIIKNGGRIEFLEDFGGNATVTVNKDSRLNDFRGGEGDVKITANGNGRIETVKVFDGSLTFKSGTGYVNSIYTWNSAADVTIGSQGAGTIQLGGNTAQSFKVTGSDGGYIAAIETTDNRTNTADDHASVINVKYFVGAIRTGNGVDKVTTGDGENGYVESIWTAGGNDVVNVGSGGVGHVNTSRDNDKIKVKELFYNEEEQAMVVRGGGGTDQLSFAPVTKGVTFSLDMVGTAQEIATGSGFISAFGIENLEGTNKGDMLTGSAGRNVILGKGGNDTLSGLAGNDTLNGAAGNDKMLGGQGADTLIGGKGRDTLDGQLGNDTLRGQGGNDIFVFGANSGTDTVKDYQDNADTLRLVGHTGGFADLTITNNSGNKVVQHDGGTIILEGRAGVTLTASDFDFV